MERFVLLLLLAAPACTAQSVNYYFGNLHAHTAFSDGNKDSVTSGVNNPAGSYAYAKLSNDFDFLGISEHNHFSSVHNPGFKLPRYQDGINMANVANEEGNFIALFGMEYGVSSTNHGHVLIYGLDSLIGWETSVPGVSGNNYNIYNAKDDYDGLFKKIARRPNAFCYLAHPWFSDYSPDGSAVNGLGNAVYNATYDSAIVGMPLRNGLATSSATNYSDYSTGNYFDYYRKLLSIGYHLGIGYDHDSHYTNFGRSNGGRLAVVAPGLTRTNLMNAMRQMHFYGSDDSNARVNFSMNGYSMGSVVSGTWLPVLSVVHNDPDGESADSIKIWKGYNTNLAGPWSWVVLTTLQNNTATFTDNNVQPGNEYHYFAEIRQADGQWIVTSPIWYRRELATGLASNAIPALAVTLSPNPVNDHLSISVSECGHYALQLLDLSGRVVTNLQFEDQYTEVETADLAPGLYFLNIQGRGCSFTRKLVVKH